MNNEIVWVVEYFETPSDHWIWGVFSTREGAEEKLREEKAEKEDEDLWCGEDGDYFITPEEVLH